MTRMRNSFLTIFFALIAATLFCISLNIDIVITSLFYRPGQGFPIGNLEPWRFLYRYGAYPSLAIGAIAGLIVVAGFFFPALERFRHQALFLFLLLIIAPGILVNSVFKDHWGRPRPRQVDIFGGAMSFHQPWEPGPAPRNASFPAGHPSVAFYLSSPYFILREKNRRQALFWLWGGILYGVIMGVARIIQGGHFVTDVIWSAGFLYLTAIALASLQGIKDS